MLEILKFWTMGITAGKWVEMSDEVENRIRSLREQVSYHDERYYNNFAIPDRILTRKRIDCQSAQQSIVAGQASEW